MAALIAFADSSTGQGVTRMLRPPAHSRSDTQTHQEAGSLGSCCGRSSGCSVVSSTRGLHTLTLAWVESKPNSRWRWSVSSHRRPHRQPRVPQQRSPLRSSEPSVTNWLGTTIASRPLTPDSGTSSSASPERYSRILTKPKPKGIPPPVDEGQDPDDRGSATSNRLWCNDAAPQPPRGAVVDPPHRYRRPTPSVSILTRARHWPLR